MASSSCRFQFSDSNSFISTYDRPSKHENGLNCEAQTLKTHPMHHHQFEKCSNDPIQYENSEKRDLFQRK